MDLELSGGSGANRIPGMVERIVYVGSTMQVIVNLAPGEKLRALVANEGEAVRSNRGRRSPSTSLARRSVLPQGEVSEEGFSAMTRAMR